MSAVFRYFFLAMVLVASSVWAETERWSETIIIDVRSRAEWNASRLEGSIWIPWTQIEQGIKHHKISTDTPIAFYCAAGVRADRAMRRLQRLGFTDMTNLISLSQASAVTGRKIQK